jgi:AcrR family transcriptional regulator
METPHRILRAHAEDLDPTLRDLTIREIGRQERIHKVAQSLFVRYGRHTITFRGLATAMKMATATLRKHYTCLDALLAALLHQHLMHISKAFGDVPHDAPNRPKALRAAYLAATRTGLGGFTEAHALFVMQRATLPPDLLESIEEIHLGLGARLGGPSALETLTFMDNPAVDAARIDAILATYEAPPAKPEPAPPPQIRLATSNTIVIAKRGKGLIEHDPDDVFIVRADPIRPAIPPPN